jgi:hypothetical protein
MAEERVQRRIRAILAADVADYARLVGADEEAWIDGAHCTGTWKPSGFTVEHIIGNGDLQTLQ